VEHVELIALISGAAIAVAFALVVSVQRSLRAGLRDLARKLDAHGAELDALREEARRATAEAEDLRRRELELTEQIAMLARQQEQMLARDPDAGRYMQAVRAASGGASVDALMNTFGLSRSEAELVVTLHRPRAGAGS